MNYPVRKSVGIVKAKVLALRSVSVMKNRVFVKTSMVELDEKMIFDNLEKLTSGDGLYQLI
ncbi:hypothetical protein [Clostridium sp. OS1-26]|uniref:hypothetical protein n=1 Tax=Clostridium sp. OS1-26 TaxID=3070681 RepID=UPI0027E0AFAA|nr:hypothetical protein [Clostridium sp. OS1-26]WML34305.1 hypothetical protein RCG18_23900 [Clostridium sp. OS1-26]